MAIDILMSEARRQLLRPRLGFLEEVAESWCPGCLGVAAHSKIGSVCIMPKLHHRDRGGCEEQAAYLHRACRAAPR